MSSTLPEYITSASQKQRSPGSAASGDCGSFCFLPIHTQTFSPTAKRADRQQQQQQAVQVVVAAVADSRPHDLSDPGVAQQLARSSSSAWRTRHTAGKTATLRSILEPQSATRGTLLQKLNWTTISRLRVHPSLQTAVRHRALLVKPLAGDSRAPPALQVETHPARLYTTVSLPSLAALV